MAHPDGPDQGTSTPTPTAVDPRWAVRLELTAPGGGTRWVVRVSDAEDLAAAVAAALGSIAGELAEHTLTRVEAFEPRSITGNPTPATRGSVLDGVAIASLAGGGTGPRHDDGAGAAGMAQRARVGRRVEA